jgi:hypothetical protein
MTPKAIGTQSHSSFVSSARHATSVGRSRISSAARCDQRAVKLFQLYRGSGFYLCCRCHHLVYQSQREDACARAFRSVSKIKKRLGVDPDVFAPFPSRPKGCGSGPMSGSARAEAAFDTQAEASCAGAN